MRVVNNTGFLLAGLAAAISGCAGRAAVDPGPSTAIAPTTAAALRAAQPAIVQVPCDAFAASRRDIPLMVADGGEERQLGVVANVGVGAPISREFARRVKLPSTAPAGPDLLVRAKPRLREFSGRLHGPPGAASGLATVSVELALDLEDEDGTRLHTILGRGAATANNNRMFVADLLLLPIDFPTSGRTMERAFLRTVARQAAERAARELAAEIRALDLEEVLVADARNLSAADAAARARAFHRRGSHARAELYLAAAKRREPNNPALPLLEGEWLLRAGRRDAARTAFERVVRQAADSVEGGVAARWLERIEQPIAVRVVAETGRGDSAGAHADEAAGRIREILLRHGNVRLPDAPPRDIVGAAPSQADGCDAVVGVEVLRDGGLICLRARVVGAQSGEIHLEWDEVAPWSDAAASRRGAVARLAEDLGARLARELL